MTLTRSRRDCVERYDHRRLEELLQMSCGNSFISNSILQKHRDMKTLVLRLIRQQLPEQAATGTGSIASLLFAFTCGRLECAAEGSALGIHISPVSKGIATISSLLPPTTNIQAARLLLPAMPMKTGSIPPLPLTVQSDLPPPPSRCPLARESDILRPKEWFV